MSLRSKVLFAAVMSFVAVAVAVTIVCQLILIEGFQKIEEQAILTDLDRASFATAGLFTGVKDDIADWAQWDDTYEFTKSHSTEFIESNLKLPSIASIGLQQMLFYGADGALVYHAGANIDFTKVELSGSLRKYIEEEPKFHTLKGPKDSVSGVVAVDEGIAFISALPILHSDGSGPVAGFLVAARYLTNTVVRQMADSLQMNLSVVPLRTSWARDELGEPSKSNQRKIVPVDEGTIRGYAWIPDLDGKPILALRIVEDRAIHTQGVYTKVLLLWTLLGSGILLIMGTLYALDRVVLSRVNVLHQFLLDTRARQDLSKRVDLSGSDEFGALGRCVNSLIEELEIALSDAKKARESAESANRSKSEFVANISHEIRTPMNGVLGMAQVLLHMNISEALKSNVRLIRDSATSLLSIINQLLDFSKMESGRLVLEQIPTDFRSVVHECTAIVKIIAEERGLCFVLDESPTMPRFIVGDPVRIRQVLINLLGNAIKFTAQGSVTLRVSGTSIVGTHGLCQLVCSVTDTGAGIAPEALPRIFRPFAQADGSTTRKFGGTGLGLSIAKTFAQMMGGDILVHSVLGRGSTFTFEGEFQELTEATYEAFHGKENRTSLTPSRSGLHVLVADDTASNRIVAKLLLEQLGHTVTCVENGAEAIAFCAQSVGAECDIIFMDILMPGVDRPSALKAIREFQPPESKPLPIIACTANAATKDLESYIKMGFSACLTKPIDRGDLAKLLSQFCPDSDGAGSSSSSSQKTSQIEVEVIELAAMRERFEGDEDGIRQIITIFLEESGELLERLRTAVEAGEPNTVRWTAHALKGSLSNVCASRAFSVAAEIESLGKSGTCSGVHEYLKILEPLVQQANADGRKILIGSVELAPNHPT